MLAAAAVGAVTGGRLAGRFGRLPVIRASFAVTALELAALVLTGLQWVYLAQRLARSRST